MFKKLLSISLLLLASNSFAANYGKIISTCADAQKKEYKAKIYINLGAYKGRKTKSSSIYKKSLHLYAVQPNFPGLLFKNFDVQLKNGKLHKAKLDDPMVGKMKMEFSEDETHVTFITEEPGSPEDKETIECKILN